MLIFRRWYLTLPVFFFVLLLTAWLMRTQLLGQVLPKMMSDAGLSDASISIDQLDADQSKISHLGFSLLLETGKLSVTAFDINITYTPAKLSKGNIDELVIDRLVIGMQADDSVVPNTPATDVSIEDMEKSIRVQAIPGGDKENTQQAFMPVQIIDQLRVALRD
ncbi:MAG: hypothetical protein RQ982_11025, partial [Gammaproteobacteria bacterium]|nr:hypothetical protein [Gammaproteobacteria bacterium]